MNLLFKILNVDLPGKIVFNGEEFFVGARQFRPRQNTTTPSSPQWVKTLVVGTTLRAAVNAAISQGVLDEPDPACTGSSKEATLIVGKEDGAIERFEDVQVLVTAGAYAFDQIGEVKHIATRVEASTEDYTNPAHPQHQTWLVMSDLCESLFRNFPHGGGASA